MAQRPALFLSLVGKGGHTGPPLRFGPFVRASSGLVGITALEPPREALEPVQGEGAERLAPGPAPSGARAVGSILFWTLPVLALAWVAFASYGALTVERYSHANGFTGELLAGHSVGQTFVSRYNGLSGIDVWVGTYGPRAPAGVALHVKEAPAGPDLVSASAPAGGIRGGNPWYTFSFPPIPNSQDRRLYVELQSPDGAAGKAITLFWWQPQGAGDAYPSGTAYVDAGPRPADLAFGLRYSPPPHEAWLQALRAVSPNAPPLLVLLLGAVVIALFGFIGHLVRKPTQHSHPLRGYPVGAVREPPLRHRLVLPAVLALAMAHGLLYLLLIPPWQGPDEFGHVAYVALLDRHNLDDRVVQKLDLNGKDGDAALGLAQAIGRSMDSHNFTRLVGWHSQPGAPSAPGSAIYAEVRQPATYYWLCAAAMRAARAVGFHIDPYTGPDAALRLMRFVSLLLSLGVVGLAWLAGRLLAGPKGLAAWLPLALPLTVSLLPMHAFAGSVANNDILAELVVSALCVAMIALVRRPRGLVGALLAILLVVLTFVSSGTKSSALTAAVPLCVCGLLYYFGFWILDFGLLRSIGPKSKVQSPKSIALFALAGVVALVGVPLLFSPLGTAAGWRLNNRPIDKAPVAGSSSAHGGQLVLSLAKDSNASQQVSMPAAQPESLVSLTGYARLGASQAVTATGRAVARLEADGLPPGRAEVRLTPGGGWAPFTATLKVSPGMSKMTARLFARGAGVEYDDLKLAYEGGSPGEKQPVLLNPSFEQQEVGLRGAVARFLPREARWIAEVAANPQSFDKAGLWAYYAREQFRSFWGNFGWVSVPLPDYLYLFWLALSALCLLGLIWKLAAARGAWGWRDGLLVIFLVSFISSVCLGFARQMMVLSVFGVEAYPQGRYLFVLSIPLAWMLLTGPKPFSSPKSVGAVREPPVQSPKSSPSRLWTTEGRFANRPYGLWTTWAWANLLVWFAGFALAALVVPYYYG